MAKKRVYKKGAPGSEYDAYAGKPEQIKRRAERNKDRKAAEKKGLVRKGDNKEVDHLGNDRTGSLKGRKTRVVSQKVNASRQPKRGKK